MSEYYYNPETGESITLEPADHADGYDAEDYRNARRVRRPGFITGGHPDLFANRRPQTRTRPVVAGPRPAPTRPSYQPAPITPAAPMPDQPSDEYLAIRKTAVADILSAGGKVWASFLARPLPPAAVGDDITDRDNATMHRDALAMHQQNQTRILALTDLAARAVKLFI